MTFTDDRGNTEIAHQRGDRRRGSEAPVPLTVSLKTAAPTSHDGSSEFTFEIEFSEEFGISYATLRDHAFNVTGGSVERAERTDKPSNIPWLITVKPQGTGGVTIELPATTDCDARGHLHRRRQEAVQLAELHRIRAGPVEQGGSAPAVGI